MLCLAWFKYVILIGLRLKEKEGIPIEHPIIENF